jgi:Cu/Ag efflux protein CusF
MSLNKIVRTAALVSVAVAVLASPAFARVKSARGNVSAVDWNAMQIAIKGVDGKINTFLVRRDTGVKFTDTPEAFPAPALKDVVPPMYVWFDFEDYEGQQPGLIQKIDVHDMPADMRAARLAGASGTDGSAVLASNERQLRVRLQTLNTKSGEFKADVAGRNTTFRATSGSLLSPFREGDLVVITIQRTNGQERVTNIQRSTSPQ